MQSTPHKTPTDLHGGVMEAVAAEEAPPPLLARARHHKRVADVVCEEVVAGVDDGVCTTHTHTNGTTSVHAVQ